MNIRNILHTERDKMQATARHLQHVLNSLDKLIEQWEAMVPPGSERLANATEVPIPEVAGVVGPNRIPLIIHLPEKDTASAEPHQPAQDRAAAPPVPMPPAPPKAPKASPVAAEGEMTHAQLCERWGCKPKRVLNLKYAGRLRGRPGMVTIESLEAYEHKSAQPLAVRHAATPSAAGMPVAEAAALLGVSTTRISQLVREGTLQRVRRGLVSPESVEQLRGKKTAPPAVPETGQKSPPKPVDEPVSRTRGSGTDEPYRPESMTTDQYATMEKAADTLGISVEQVREMKARPLAKDDTEPTQRSSSKPIEDHISAAEHWSPQHAPNDRYETMDKAARDLNCNTDWLRTVKKSGRIDGAPDWINMTQLEAYLKHPDFEAPLIHREP